MNPVLINIGSFEIRWYSFLILVGFGVGYLLVINQCKKKNIAVSVISDLCFYMVIFCILGARLYYCLFNLDYYGTNPVAILKIWEGGLAIHGGIIAGILCIYFYCKKKHLSMLELLDIFAPALVLGQAIGRWGNFFNSEAYGPKTTLENLKGLHIPNFVINGMKIDGFYHHPTFFYESVGCLIIFIILLIIRNNKKIKEGQVAAIYLVLYGTIRFFIESLRQDSLMLLNLKVAQLISILMILIGLYIFIIALRRKDDKQKMGRSTKRRI